MQLPRRISVIGSGISACGMDAALQLVDQRLRDGGGGYVCFTNVHGVVMGREDPAFRAVTNGSFLSLADGKPVYWTGRCLGAADLGHVAGPDFFLACLRRFASRRHYFLGSTPPVLRALVENLRAGIPGLNVCGSLSPPFRALSPEESAAQLQEVAAARPDFIWVGLGAPKQERFMSAAAGALAPALLFGVGAAFDFQAGSVRRAPLLLRRLGLEWLYRLAQEPRRLWRRYLTTNAKFLYYLFFDAVGHRKS